jgi:hypothetical protein
MAVWKGGRGLEEGRVVFSVEVGGRRRKRVDVGAMVEVLVLVLGGHVQVIFTGSSGHFSGT